MKKILELLGFFFEESKGALYSCQVDTGMNVMLQRPVACEEYDNAYGSRPITNQLDVRWEEMTAWRGEHVDRLSLGV